MFITLTVSLSVPCIRNQSYDTTYAFFSTIHRDGMEASIGGMGGVRGYRPTLNSYRYGDAMAIAKMALQFNQEVRGEELWVLHHYHIV